MSLSHGKIGHSSGRPAVMENLEKANFLPGHGKVRELCKKKKKNHGKMAKMSKVMEKSGNFSFYH